jgi:hypothetical protein
MVHWGVIMNDYDADSLAELRHRFRAQYGGSRLPSNQSNTPAIKMLISDWQVDDLGVWTREIKARD